MREKSSSQPHHMRGAWSEVSLSHDMGNVSLDVSGDSAAARFDPFRAAVTNSSLQTGEYSAAGSSLAQRPGIDHSGFSHHSDSMIPSSRENLVSGILFSPHEEDVQKSYIRVKSPGWDEERTEYDMPVIPSKKKKGGRLIDPNWLDTVGAYTTREDDNGNVVRDVLRTGPASLRDNKYSQSNLLNKGHGGGWAQVGLKQHELREKYKTKRHRVTSGTVTYEKIEGQLREDIKNGNPDLGDEKIEEEVKKVKRGFESQRSIRRKEREDSRKRERKKRMKKESDNLMSTEKQEALQNYQKWNKAKARLIKEAKCGEPKREITGKFEFIIDFNSDHKDGPSGELPVLSGMNIDGASTYTPPGDSTIFSNTLSTVPDMEIDLQEEEKDVFEFFTYGDDDSREVPADSPLSPYNGGVPRVPLMTLRERLDPTYPPHSQYLSLPGR